MIWQLIIDDEAKKQLERIPTKQADRITLILKSLAVNPYGGDIQKMVGEKDVWRRRVGSYRIFYEVHTEKRIVYVFDIKRRTSKIY